MSPERQHAYLGLVLVQVLFGVHYLATKIVLQEVPPRAWAAMRAGGATLVLLAVVAVLARGGPPRPIARGDWLRMAGLSLFGVVINQLCFIEGMARTTATHASILITAIPVGTLLFAVLLGRERMTVPKVLALVISTTGVLLVVRPTASAQSPVAPSLAGDLLIVVNALSYAFFLVASKPVLERVSPARLTTATMAVGGLVLIGVAGDDLARLEPASLSTTVWIWMVLIVVFPTALGYLLNYWALKRVESSLVGLFIYLQPVVGTVLAVAFLGERPGAEALVGALLIFGGVYLALPRPR